VLGIALTTGLKFKRAILLVEAREMWQLGACSLPEGPIAGRESLRVARLDEEVPANRNVIGMQVADQQHRRIAELGLRLSKRKCDPPPMSTRGTACGPIHKT
jgi:hypothetical protein